MNIALGSDERTELTETVAEWLREQGHTITLFGALAESADTAWPSVAHAVGLAVTKEDCPFGIVCCWTGTGVSIAANKVPGVRAALCIDAQTAEGARTWNDANVLCLSLRSTSTAVAKEILAAWFNGKPTTDPHYRAMINALL